MKTTRKYKQDKHFSLSLFVNLESCCIAWGANTTETDCEGAVSGWRRHGDKKIRPETYKRRARGRTGQESVCDRAGRLAVPQEETTGREFRGRSLRTEP